MNRAELVSQRRQTTAYIKAESTTITLTRNARTKTATGGYTDDPTTLDPQNFKVLWASLAQQFVTPSGSGGRAQVTHDQLLGRWDADIRVGDTFTLDTEDYTVEEVSRTPYRVIATLMDRSERA